MKADHVLSEVVAHGGMSDSLLPQVAAGTYTAAELKNFGLPVLPRSARGISKRASLENWPILQIKGRGGSGGVGHRFTVPAYVLSAIHLKNAAHSDKTLQRIEAKTDLTERQRHVAQARASLLLHVHRLAATAGTDRAIREVVSAADGGRLPVELAGLVSIANDRAGTSRTLTRATLYRWLAKFDLNQPNAVDQLAPRNTGATKRANWLRETASPWADAALRLYQRPQKPSIRWVEEELPKHLPAGVTPPSYDTLRRFLASMGNVALQAGRMGPRELKNLKPFVRRDKSMLWPGEVFMADGHAFDSEVAHPRHGRPFRPEITSVVDAATRRIVGWSVDLAESGLAVLDALRVATMRGCIPAIFYVDRGPGYRNAMISAPGTGLLSRLGTSLEHSLPYNSQARGVIERLHQTVWVRAAKELPTYIGAPMDPEAKNKVHKLTRRDIKTFGASRVLMPWPEFVRFAADHVDRYNSRPQRGLPMLSDPATGKRRHMTPTEAWEKGLDDGAQLITLLPEEADNLFRPQQPCRILRGEIRLFNNIYFSHELTEYHGDGVNVGYDIHDPSQVWVYDADGVLICKAQLDGNRRDFFPESVLEQANRKRVEGQLRRLQSKVDAVNESLQDGPLVIENAPSPVASFLQVLDQETIPTASLQSHQTVAPPVAAEPARPLFTTPAARYEWLMEHKSQWEASDRDFLREYVRDPDGYALFAQRHELLGYGWTDNDQQQLNDFNPSRRVA